MVTDTRDSVLKLPNAALRFRPAGNDAKESAAAAAPGPPRNSTAGKPTRSANAGRVYVLNERGEPRALIVSLGLTDGASTELGGSELAEGAQVVIGSAPAGKTSGAPSGGPRPGF